MRLLLDTHIALWTLIDSPRLPLKARALIAASDTELFVSVASLWEVAIKYSLRRGAPGDMPISSTEMMRLVSGAQCNLLHIGAAHLLKLEQLPWLHRDPFDRMLVAQAQAEPLRLLSVDAAVAEYGDPVEIV